MAAIPDNTGALVLDWMTSHADGDGVVEYGGPQIANALSKPQVTVQHALRRLEKRGKVYMLSFGRYVVVDLIDTLSD